MAIERKADTSTKVAVAGDRPKVASGRGAASRSAANSQGKQPRRAAASTAKPTAAVPAPKVAQLRAELSAARRDLALGKLDSPAAIRKLRKDLARALTAENAAATKEAA